MSEPVVVVYVPDQPIDTTKPLQVENLPRSHWGPIGRAYPDIAWLIPLQPVSFFGTRNTTVFPPVYLSASHLKMISKTQEPRKRWVYPRHGPDDQLLGVVVHLVGSGGGYDAVHIYRLQPRRPRRWLRRQ